jgi:hypothetical protein
MRFGARSVRAGFGRGGDGISRTKKTTATTSLSGRRGKKKAALAGGFFLFFSVWLKLYMRSRLGLVTPSKVLVLA